MSQSQLLFALSLVASLLVGLFVRSTSILAAHVAVTTELVEDRSEFERGAKVRAVATVEEWNQDQPLELSFVWIDATGRETFRKREQVHADEVPSRVKSSIRLGERRGPGDYELRVFAFRRLMSRVPFRVSETWLEEE